MDPFWRNVLEAAVIVMAMWQSHIAMKEKDYPEAAWWAWAATLVVMIG